MAKVGFWLRGAKGKLAGASLSKGAYGTVAREIVTPKNPNSEGQIIQRIILGTVGKAYKRLRDICDHSFEGLTPGAKSMAYFMKVNLNNLRAVVADAVDNQIDLSTVYAFSPVGSSAMMANSYVVSQGSLPSVPVTRNDVDGGAYILIGDNTYEGVCKAYGLQRGDQLTFVEIDHRANSQGHDFFFTRVILDPRKVDGSAADMTEPFIVDGAVNLPSPMNEGDFANLSVEDDKLYFNVNDATTCAAGVIVSREVNGSWLRSNCTLTVLRLHDGIDFATALARSKQAIAIQTGSDKYLNNAGVSNVTGAEIKSALTYSVVGSASVALSVDEDIIANGSDVLAGSLVTATITPTGQYGIEKVTLNGQELTVTDGVVVFEMPAKAASLRVFMAIPTYPVTVNATGQGTVQLKVGDDVFASGATFAEGTEITVNVTSGELYSMNWNGTTIADGGTFTMPAQAVVVQASFAGASSVDEP